MTVSEAQNKARNKWDQEHMKNGSYKMNIELYKIFEKYCIDKGLSKNGVINDAIKEVLKKDGYIMQVEHEK